MILRDNLNSTEGYIQILERQNKYIIEEYDDLRSYDEVIDKEKIIVSWQTILKYSLDNFLVKYSIGEDLQELEREYLNLIIIMEKGWKKSNGYIQMLWVLSIGIMLEINQNEFAKLEKLIKSDDLQDYLIDFLISFRDANYESRLQIFMFPEPYQATKEIIELAAINKQSSLERLKNYLQKEWYKGHSDMGWYEGHKSKWNTHSGYWSFESGALVKILGLDDTILKEQQYYPYDMVHWKPN